MSRKRKQEQYGNNKLTFVAPIVTDCPEVKANRGVIHMPHPILASLAGAVKDEDQEWLVIFKGTRMGLETHINEMLVPKQERSQARVAFNGVIEYDSQHVAILHSHHTMGAFFSATDITDINGRFPISIVISSSCKDDASRLMGFAYKAVGKYLLPCGEMGETEYYIMPSPVPDGWPAALTFTAQHITPHPGQPEGDCRKYIVDTVTTDMEARHCECGYTTLHKRTSIFGTDGTNLIKVIHDQTTPCNTLQLDYSLGFQRECDPPFYSEWKDSKSKAQYPPLGDKNSAYWNMWNRDW